MPLISKKKRSISRADSLKSAVLVAFFVVLSVLACTYLIYQNYKSSLQEELKRNLSQMTYIVASLIDGESYKDHLSKGAKIRTNKNVRGMVTIKKVIKSDPSIGHIYTMLLKNDKELKFILIASREQFDRYYQAKQPPDEAQQVYRKLFNGKKHDIKVFSDDWEEFVTAFAPVVDNAELPVGFVGVELDMRHYQDKLDDIESSLTKSFLLALILAFLIGLLVYLISRNHQRVVAVMDKSKKLADSALSRYRIAVEGTNDGIWDWHIKNDKVYCSATFMELLNYDKSEKTFALADVTNFIHPEERDFFTDAMNDHLKNETPLDNLELRLHTKDDKYKWFLLRGKAIRKSGKPYRMGGSIKDITKRKLYLVQLEHAKEKAEAANRTKSTFLANTSHELRTPLNAIIGFADLMMAEVHGKLEPEGREQYKDYAKDIHNSGKHLLEIINDILDLSKAEAGKIEVHITEVGIKRLVQEALSMVNKKADNRGIELKNKIGASIPKIYIDRIRLKQIIVNLLSNAIKFTEEGGVVYIEVEQEKVRDQKFVNISIIDNGIGISDENQIKIFKNFEQVENKMNRNYEGTGLGLALSRNLAQLMGGDISLQSKLGVGSSFTVKLPVFKSEKEAQQKLNPNIAEGSD